MRVDSAIITGAGSGIGRAVALSLGAMGVKVLCVSRTKKCEGVAKQIVEQGGSAQGLVLDLQDYSRTEQLVSAWWKTRKLGRCCVILAGAILGPITKSHKSPLHLWEKVFRINILGNLAVLYALMPHMIRQRFGRVIFFSGGGAAYAFPKFSAYSASKTALVRIVENLHQELSTLGDIAVVGLAPGAVKTRMLEKVKKAGAVVRTECSVDEAVNFVRKFLNTDTTLLSGRLIHVRDDWSNLKKIRNPVLLERHWKLRRVE